MGWVSVAAVSLLQMVAAYFLMRRAAQRWWDYLVVVVLAAILLRPLFEIVTGDISRVLPPFLWSDGPDGKDQIIIASIASTFLLPLIVSAATYSLIKRVVFRRQP